VTLSGLLIALALAGTSPAPRVLAHVDSVQITRADLEERLRMLRSRRLPADPAGQVGALIDEALLAGEGRKLGLERTADVLGLMEQERRRLAVDAYVTSAVPEPAEADLKALYHQTGDSIRLIVVKLETEADAGAALLRIQAGGEISAEARRSLDQTLAARGGDTGLLTRASVQPGLAEAAFAASVGAVIGPLRLDLGWAIAQVMERHVADEASFAERRDSIAAFARDRMRKDTRAHLIEHLRRKSNATVDDEFLAKVGAAPSDRDLDHTVATVGGKPIRYRDLLGMMPNVPSGHGAGAARSAFAWREVDRAVLETEAVARGFEKDPSVGRALPGIERNLLASAAADRIAARANAPAADPKVRETLERLRAKAKIRVDQAAVDAAERELR
jgi:peptidyl-prolyl cis-trans isomerase C